MSNTSGTRPRFPARGRGPLSSDQPGCEPALPGVGATETGIGLRPCSESALDCGPVMSNEHSRAETERSGAPDIFGQLRELITDIRHLRWRARAVSAGGARERRVFGRLSRGRVHSVLGVSGIAGAVAMDPARCGVRVRRDPDALFLSRHVWHVTSRVESVLQRQEFKFERWLSSAVDWKTRV